MLALSASGISIGVPSFFTVDAILFLELSSAGPKTLSSSGAYERTEGETRFWLTCMADMSTPEYLFLATRSGFEMGSEVVDLYLLSKSQLSETLHAQGYVKLGSDE